jgi:hypothetical protein
MPPMEVEVGGQKRFWLQENGGSASTLFGNQTIGTSKSLILPS